MKKTVLLILWSLGASFLHAQIKLDSVVTVGDSKKFFTYHDEGNAVESIEYKLETATNQWKLHNRDTWTYAGDEMTHTTYNWNHALQQWTPATRVVLNYSSEFLYEIYEWNSTPGVWKGISREYTLITPFGSEYYNDSWNPATLSWQYWLKTTFYTNQAGNTTEEISYKWINNAWALTTTSRRKQFSYDAEGRLLEAIQARWNTSTSSWINEQKENWEYNASGQTTDYARYNWGILSNEWLGYLRSSITYENNKVLSDISYNWEENGNFWKPDNQRIYAYNTESTSIGHYYWEENGNFWKPLRQYVYIVHADSTRTATELFNFDTVLGDWVFERTTAESLFSYTPDGKLSEKIESNWYEPLNALTYAYKTNYAYDAAGNVIDYATYNWNAFLENWYNVRREIKEYDLTWDQSELICPETYSYLFETGKLTSFELYSLNPIFNDWQLESESYYYFSEVITGADEANAAEALKLFPNPVSDLLTLGANAPRTSSYQITDLSGRVLQYEKSWNGGVIDVSRLIPGSYIIRLIEGNRVIMGKFIKS